MSKLDAKSLFEKYQSGKCSPGEQAIVENWLTFGEATDLNLSETELAADLEEIKQRTLGRPRKAFQLWPGLAGVAAAVTAVVLCIYFFSSKYETLKPVQVDVAANDIEPGRNGATITLADGKVIQLSGAKKGVVIGEGLKYDDGSVVRYSSGSQASGPAAPGQKRTGPVGVHSLHPSELQGAEGVGADLQGAEGVGADLQGAKGVGAGLRGADGRALMLTASTAKGQTYQFTLPDGTKVWLNADSKISFPSQFSGKERKILLSGEGYFEVVHNAKQPFRVESKTADGKMQTVEDIGTAFNINAYVDERGIKTTLVEGIAEVYTAAPVVGPGIQKVPGMRFVLKPNHQAVFDSQKIRVSAIDASDAVSWKNGYFQFNAEDLQSVMKKLSRWYDIQVEYENPETKQVQFSGTMSRYDQIGQVLKKIAGVSNVKYCIRGKTVILK